MMALWLTRALPPLGIAIALIGSVWWIDHRGYRRAMADRDASDARMVETLRGDLRAGELRLAARMDAIGEDYERHRSAISGIAATVQPVIIKEAAREPRLSDPALGLTPGLLDAVTAPARLAPVPPMLPAALRAPCPPLPVVKGNTIAELAMADAQTALAYADCAGRHAGAVNAYHDSRETALRWNQGGQ